MITVGLDTFSLAGLEWDAIHFLDFAADAGFDAVELRPQHLGPTHDPEWLVRVRRRAEELAIGLEVGMGSIDPLSDGFDSTGPTPDERLAETLRVAKALGATNVRCFLGSERDRTGPQPIRAHIEACIAVLRRASPVAERLEITIAVQNHRFVDLLAPELATLVDAVDSKMVGACYDTGNSAFTAEDPERAAETLGGRILTMHLRDTYVWPSEVGAWAQWVPLGVGNVGLEAVIKRVHARNPLIPMHLELLSGYAPHPVPYLDVDSWLWKAYPEMTATDFSRYLARVRGAEPRANSEFDRPALDEPLAAEARAELMATRMQELRSDLAWVRDVVATPHAL